MSLSFQAVVDRQVMRVRLAGVGSDGVSQVGLNRDSPCNCIDRINIRFLS